MHQIGQPYILKVQISDDYNHPIIAGNYVVQFKRNSDGYYWNGSGWVDDNTVSIILTHDQKGSWYVLIPGSALNEEGQYTSLFDGRPYPDFVDSFDLEVGRMTSQWSVVTK